MRTPSRRSSFKTPLKLALAGLLVLAGCPDTAPPPPGPNSGFYRYEKLEWPKNCASSVSHAVEEHSEQFHLTGSAELEDQRVVYFLTGNQPDVWLEVFYRFDSGMREIELAALGSASWPASASQWRPVLEEMQTTALWRQLVDAASCH